MHVVAGFWNSHVHLLGPDLMSASTRDPATLETALRALLTRWGFTAAFDIASVPGNTLALRQRIERGELHGPLLLTVDAPFYPAGGTPIYVRKLYQDNQWPSAEVGTADAARERARRQLAAGADGVKLFTGAIVGGPVEVLPLDRAISRAAVDEAKKRGKPAFAHPTDLRGIDIAIDAGVTILAHPTPTEGPWTPQLVSRLKASDVALTPTLGLFESELARSGAPAEIRERFARNAAQQTKALADAGGTILFGTDAGYLPNADTTRELELMAEAGLAWQAILASLTTAPARRHGYAERKGRVMSGMDADFVILGTDPTRGGKAFADVRYTIRGGNVLYRAQ
jgi:imidazolonepropionase-like amidohydrolase